MREKWIVETKKGDFNGLSAKLKVSPLAVRCLMNRGVESEQEMREFLYGTLDDLHDPFLMKGMDEAVREIVKAKEQGRKVAIASDFDCDGIFSAYILWKGFQKIGLDSEIFTPDRVKEGYGLNRRIVDEALAGGRDFLVTCDNGIAAESEIAYAKEMGMTVIVTDHHEVPYTDEGEERIYHLPPADAVVDPKQPGCEYPFKGLCGAAVAYKCMECLYEAMGEDSTDLDYLLEPVGIATIGDVMDLTDENRIFVKQALEMMGHSSNPGLRALMQCTGVPIDQVRAYHVGFVLGPCINAGGRLDTAKRALALLRAKNERDAMVLAGDLKALNDSRKELTEWAVEEAAHIVEEKGYLDDRVLVIYLPDCHESIAGERYYRPVYVLTDSEDGVKGSGRSIEAYHMFEELIKCSDLLTKFGGHRQAAGLSMEPGKVDAFRRRLNENCTLTEKDLQEKVSIDMELPFSNITEQFIEELELLEPFGKGNTKPVFAVRNAELLSARIIGKERNMLKFQIRDDSRVTMEALYFGDASVFMETVTARYGRDCAERLLAGKSSGIRMSFTFYPGINEYMGNRSMQIIITHYM